MRKEGAGQSVGQGDSLGVLEVGEGSLEGQLPIANRPFVTWGGPAPNRTSWLMEPTPALGQGRNRLVERDCPGPGWGFLPGAPAQPGHHTPPR